MIPYADLLSTLLLISSFIGLLVSTALTFVNRIQLFSNRLLASSFLSVAIFAIVSALLINHAIFFVPHAFRIGAPFQYLFAPLAYLYVRSVLYKETCFRTYDWLHFIPFFLHTAELMPFYLQSAQYKLYYLKQLLIDIQGVIKLQEAILPVYYHAILKFVQGNIYVLLQWQLIWQFSRKFTNHTPQPERGAIKLWLTIFSLLNTGLYLPTLITIFLPLHPDVTALFALFILGGYLLICSILLFFQPKILYGLVEAPPVMTHLSLFNPKEEPSRSYIMSGEKKSACKEKIETYFLKQLPYLIKGYSIKDLASETGIPLHQLSAFINSEYEVNFSDFINRHRVEYAKQKLRDPQWRQLTLEGIALEAGFNNRITFFRAFTKHTGCTTSEYLNEQSAAQE